MLKTEKVLDQSMGLKNLMSTKLLKIKIINIMLNKNKNKYCTEKRFKLNLKKLTKITNKCSKFILFLIINYYLPIFQLIKKSVRIKKIKLIKYKPFFILKNKNKITFSVKQMIKVLKNKKNNELTLLKNAVYKTQNAQEQISNYYNVLTFYRWNF